jgi:hypothetical protein
MKIKKQEKLAWKQDLAKLYLAIRESEPFAGVLFVIISQLHLDWSGAMYGVRTEKMYLALSPCSLQTLKIGACNMIRCAVVK